MKNISIRKAIENRNNPVINIIMNVFTIISVVLNNVTQSLKTEAQLTKKLYQTEGFGFEPSGWLSCCVSAGSLIADIWYTELAHDRRYTLSNGDALRLICHGTLWSRILYTKCDVHCDMNIIHWLALFKMFVKFQGCRSWSFGLNLKFADSIHYKFKSFESQVS